MQRRTLILGGTVLAASTMKVAGASAASAKHVGAAINNRGTRLVRFRFKPGGRQIWEAWCVESERRRQECVVTMQSEGVRTECCYLSEDGEELYYFEDTPDWDKADAAYKNSHFAMDAEHAAKVARCLERVGPLKTLFEFHNPSMS